MPYLVRAIDYRTGQTQKFTLQLPPWHCFKVNAEQAINRKSGGQHWTVTDMQPLLVSAPF
jgi:hypothetical protein